jgi:heterodisulfide reductase subunit A
VITSLDAERLLREAYVLQRPSDGKPAERIAFIQCVGSRDAQLGHDWCSTICCGSSLRMARLIQSRHESASIVFFYIDVQSFGKNFVCAYGEATDQITMIRSIPGEISRTADDALEVTYFDPRARAAAEAIFDLVVLSVGLTPVSGNRQLARVLNLPIKNSGFLTSPDGRDGGTPPGVFTAGTATGPMSIADSVASAEKAAYDVIRHLNRIATGRA